MRRYAFLAALLAVPVFCSGAERNLAGDVLLARSSPALDGHAAAAAVDGSVDTYWAAEGSPSDPAWIEVEWGRAEEISEVVVRRYLPEKGAPDITSLEIEAFGNGNWDKIQTMGDGQSTLAVITVARFTGIATQRLRISGLRVPVRFTEIEIYAKPCPPYFDVRGDAKGKMIGVLTDAFGARGFQTGIAVSGTAGGKAWHSHVETSPSGDFSAPMPVGLTGAVHFSAPADGEMVERTVDSADIHQGLVPRPSDEDSLKLNGPWKFSTDPPAGFEKSDFDDQSWSNLDVPSHWEMKGFHSVDGAGGYRKSISIPKAWNGRRLRLAFDGVYSSAEVWCNGIRVGAHTGGATPFQLDITRAAKPGARNEIAVRVEETSRASELDHMSVYADFSLAGIFRSAYIFAVPAVHVGRMHSFTEFGPGYRDATLVTELTIVNESDARAPASRLALILSGPHSAAVVAQSEPVAIDLEPWTKAEKRVRIHVDHPLPWSAEHPDLYTLTATLENGAAPPARIARGVGFRETKIEGKELRLNGVPVKLKGTCHHDSHPLMGRAVTPELERQDLLLMKEANLDSLRTSHYPSIPELLDLADELGVYVEEEASFCWVNNANDLRYAALVRQLTSEMVERDLSHPSVIYWSSANESSWGPILTAGEKLIRESDPTRPVVGSWSDHVDMEIHHNPITVEQIHKYESNTKPVIWDESLGIFQGIFDEGDELWRDPGYRDYYVAPLIDVWETLWHSKTTQGSFIWAWSDDLFLVPGRASEFGRSHAVRHGLDSVYHEPGRGLVGDAPWGVVDGWRRRKPEFWHIKELHSPIKVTARSLPMPAKDEPLRVPVENRYFFTRLSELETRWKIDGHAGSLRPEVEPQHSGTIELPLPFPPSPGSNLELQFVDAGGKMVDAAVVRIGEAPPDRPASPAREFRITSRRNLADEATVVSGDGFEFAFSGRSGLLRYALTRDQTVLYDQPQVWVLPIDDATQGFPARLTWAAEGPPEVNAGGQRITVITKGHYRDLAGTYQTTISGSGEATFVYNFRYTGPDVRVRELGARFGLPLSFDRLSWKRQGEWTWYPADHIAALEGNAKAHSGRPAGVVPDWPFGEDDSPEGTNAFRSTKRNIRSAAILDNEGRGLHISSDSSQHLRAMVDTDRIVVHVNTWFGGTNSEAGEWTENYHDGKMLRSGDSIAGKVTLRLQSGQELHANR